MGRPELGGEVRLVSAFGRVMVGFGFVLEGGATYYRSLAMPTCAPMKIRDRILNARITSSIRIAWRAR